MNRLFSCIFLFLLSLYAHAAIKNVGYSFVQNYAKADYQGGTQNWNIAQDSSGIMYFGNNTGLIVYDGASWRTYNVPNLSTVRAVYTNSNHKVYIGAFNEFGFFTSNSNGDLEYTSLSVKIPSNMSNFGDIWNILGYNQGILFLAGGTSFLYENDSISLPFPGKSLHYLETIKNTHYFFEPGLGIVKLITDKLVKVPGSEKFLNRNITGVLPYASEALMVFTREEGIYILNNGEVVPWISNYQKYCIDNQIFCVSALPDNLFALGTVQDGVLILDKKGNLIQHINRGKGLQNNTVLSLFFDHQQNLWLGLDNGIDYILLNSPLSYLANQNSLGSGYTMAFSQGDLYFGSNQGLFRAKWPFLGGTNEPSSAFNFIEGSQGQVWSLTEDHGELLVGHDKGTFVLKGPLFSRISNKSGGWNFLSVPERPDLLIEGTYSGLIVYEKNEKAKTNLWSVKSDLTNIKLSCRQMAFDEAGKLWVAHAYLGVYCIKLSNTYDSIIEVKHFSTENGLPFNYKLNILSFAGKVLIGSPEGVYSYNEANQKFERDEEITLLFDGSYVHRIIKDKNANYWLFSNNSVCILKSNYDGSYSLEKVPFLPLKGHFIQTHENILFIDNENILFSTEDGYIHFDPSYRKNYHESFKTIISKVSLLPDSVIYGGFKIDKNVKIDQKISYPFNSLRFSFAAPFFESDKQTTYQYKLTGYENNFSDWTSSSEKEYTNLGEGNYSFVVRARNIFGEESQPVSIEFTILPPFYRSNVAYFLYILFISFISILGLFFLKRRFERMKQELKLKQKNVLLEKEEAYAAESLKTEQVIMMLRNEKLEAENKKNKAELDGQKKELASVAMQINYKNELLTQVKQKLLKVSQKMVHLESKRQVEALVKALEKDTNGKEDWEKFEMHFDHVHEDFMKKLRNNFKELTPKDLRLCAYLKMNLASKEIAPLLNISIRGVEISRYRMRKKLGLSREANLTDFLMNI